MSAERSTMDILPIGFFFSSLLYEFDSFDFLSLVFHSSPFCHLFFFGSALFFPSRLKPGEFFFGNLVDHRPQTTNTTSFLNLHLMGGYLARLRCQKRRHEDQLRSSNEKKRRSFSIEKNYTSTKATPLPYSSSILKSSPMSRKRRGW